jgi:outer membrane protein TolC
MHTSSTRAGVTDKTDYKRATIALNNAKAQKRSGEQSLKAKYAYLKELMGYPVGQNFELQYDTAQLKTEIYIDTLQVVSYNNRIEFQLLQTQKNLLQYNLSYARWSFLPDLSLFCQLQFKLPEQ